MKTNFLLLLLLSALGAHGQGTALTYQGRLNDVAGPASGKYEFQFTVRDALTDGNAVGVNPLAATLTVSNGLFTVTLDPGADVFTGADRWLEIAVRSTGEPLFTTLSPRQKITATPYAITAGTVTGTIPLAQLPPALVTNGASGVNLSGTFTGNGASLTGLNASQLTSGTVPTAALGNAWKTTGNAGTTPGTHFLGTTDNQPLELLVNGGRALRLENNGDSADLDSIPDGAPNLIAGSPRNFVGAGVVGATIAGGGATNYSGTPYTNSVLSDFAVVGGGLRNTIAANSRYASIGGGTRNAIGTNSIASAIGSGYNNTIEANSPYATIAGGYFNAIGANSEYSAIGGGGNAIADNANSATIAGGSLNAIGANASYGAIGGGFDNTIADNANSATIAGGDFNAIGANSYYSAIGGGQDNNIAVFSSSATIAGGYLNDIGTDSAYSAIGGGQDNNIVDNSPYTTIPGGRFNNIGTDSAYSAIGGGYDNNIADNSPSATIAGGYLNDILDYSWRATIAGGLANRIGTNSHQGAIGGGWGNRIADNSENATIPGGYFNTIGTNSDSSAIGGGWSNNIAATSPYATIAGGYINDIGRNSDYSAIGGGWNNNIEFGSYGNLIGGGYNNTILSGAYYATIPGGHLNTAFGYAFAAGNRAKAYHYGSFVWGDASIQDVASTAANSVTMRASGGYRLFSNSSATAGVSLAAGGTAWGVISDRNAKKDFTPVDSREVLEKLAALPITRWHYNWEQTDETPHIGPMAQDFKAAFYPGRDDKSITTQETDGVALAAIQGLNQKVEAGSQRSEDRIQKLEAENAELKRQMVEIKNLLGQVIDQTGKQL